MPLLVCKHIYVIVYLSKHAFMHVVLVVESLWVCVSEHVCLQAGVSDEDIRVSRARAGSEC